jgi:hypothetical protein
LTDNNPPADSANTFWARAGRFLRQPLVIAILAGAFSAYLIPSITRQWQDAQSERDLKQTLLDQISSSGTAAIHHGFSMSGGQLVAAGATVPRESIADVYQSLKDTWYIDRADARSRILVYFPSLYACWYSFDHAVADYLSLGGGNRAQPLIDNLRTYVMGGFATSYVAPTVADGCKPVNKLPQAVFDRYEFLIKKPIWPYLALTGKDKATRGAFQSAYSILGEEMDIAMERVVYTIVKTHAEGFSHGTLGL